MHTYYTPLDLPPRQPPSRQRGSLLLLLLPLLDRRGRHAGGAVCVTVCVSVWVCREVWVVT